MAWGVKAAKDLTAAPACTTLCSLVQWATLGMQINATQILPAPSTLFGQHSQNYIKNTKLKEFCLKAAKINPFWNCPLWSLLPVRSPILHHCIHYHQACLHNIWIYMIDDQEIDLVYRNFNLVVLVAWLGMYSVICLACGWTSMVECFCAMKITKWRIFTLLVLNHDVSGFNVNVDIVACAIVFDMIGMKEQNRRGSDWLISRRERAFASNARHHIIKCTSTKINLYSTWWMIYFDYLIVSSHGLWDAISENASKTNLMNNSFVNQPIKGFKVHIYEKYAKL